MFRPGQVTVLNEGLFTHRSSSEEKIPGLTMPATGAGQGVKTNWLSSFFATWCQPLESDG